MIIFYLPKEKKNNEQFLRAMFRSHLSSGALKHIAVISVIKMCLLYFFVQVFTTCELLMCIWKAAKAGKVI